MTQSPAPAQSKLAKFFLYAIAAIALTVGISGAYLVINRVEIMLSFITPEHGFDTEKKAPQPNYQESSAWAIHPEGRYSTDFKAEDTEIAQKVDTFFIPPTTLFSKEYWNDPLTLTETEVVREQTVDPFLPTIFSPFSRVFAPKYRQATNAALQVDSKDAHAALALATSDIIAAFDAYLATWNKGRPFMLVGHDQGSYHLLRLLKDRIDGTPLANKMITAWVVGWPVSESHDLNALKTPTCDSATATGCLISWNSYMQGGKVDGLMQSYAHLKALDGIGSVSDMPLCINPLSWKKDHEVITAEANMGSVAMMPQASLAIIDLKIGAACSQDGGLFVNKFEHPSFNSFLMPDESLHMYDYALFYMNVRANAKTRTADFLGHLK